jgi:hypothetical protein
MKIRILKIAFTLFLALIIVSPVYSACSSITANPMFTDVSIENLRAGVKNNNEGVRKCCIYFAGKYKISDLREALMDQLTYEKNPRIRILIALSLYQIEDSEEIEFLKIFAVNDKDQEVRRMCTAIYNEYWKNSFQKGIKLSSLNEE